MTQGQRETVLQCVTRLRAAAKDCGYDEDTEKQIRDEVLSQLRPWALALAHEGHLSIVDTKQKLRTKVSWAQTNGEVERQNASLLKRKQIAQAESRDSRKEVRKYLTSYRSIEHPTTGKSPAELLFGRKMRGKLPEMTMNHVSDVAVRDRDAEQFCFRSFKLFGSR
ncbi:hypothetical protein NP493_829g01024 [Ridgeia piscesae]|uniref:Uncharacterized protein n=1 Tax=Ridgeia piscesae TaxID=27915 RepID=A0AAD9NMR0_RIDPI|nr:hypothetical protein NP493_829g01024 [Ridgeia piscesae]